MADDSRNAYGEFVGNLVPLAEAQQQGERGAPPSFAAFAERLAGRSHGWQFSSFVGAGFLAGAALCSAALPSPSAANDGFWRVGRSAVADVLAVGNAVAVPLALAALVLLVLGIAAALRRGGITDHYLAVQPFIGGVGLLGVGIVWAGFLALALANFAVLILIIIAYIVATILITALVIGFLIGLVSQ